MLTEGENYKSHLKDSSFLPVSYNQRSFYSRFHDRTNKLVTALFMVTDIMDTEEPLRLKLRSAGADLLSDIYTHESRAYRRITEILSFINITSTLNMISGMNSNILIKEFSRLQEDLRESNGFSSFLEENKLLDFLKENNNLEDKDQSIKTQKQYLKYTKPTRVGVQKGGTLMKVLSDKISHMSVSNSPSQVNYDVLKQIRRQEILDILKGHLNKTPANLTGLTITDIKNLATGALKSCGDKTLQRELVSMVKDGTLKKIGNKRWSKYLLVSA
jgi:hypothetical protein